MLGGGVQRGADKHYLALLHIDFVGRPCLFFSKYSSFISKINS